MREWGNRAHARNLLDVQVNAETVRNHVTYRLAELEQTALEETSSCPWPRPAIAGRPLPTDATTRQLAQRLLEHVHGYANRAGLEAIRDDLRRCLRVSPPDGQL